MLFPYNAACTVFAVLAKPAIRSWRSAAEKKNEKRNEKKIKLEFFLFTTSFETDPKLPNVIQLGLVENKYLVVQLNILSVVKLILP